MFSSSKLQVIQSDALSLIRAVEELEGGKIISESESIKLRVKIVASVQERMRKLLEIEPNQLINDVNEAFALVDAVRNMRKMRS